jgi:hypothetical protein
MPPAHVFGQPKRVQRAEPVGHDHDPGARFPEFGAAFEEGHFMAQAMQPYRGRHSCEPGADHHDPHETSSNIHYGRTSTDRAAC